MLQKRRTVERTFCGFAPLSSEIVVKFHGFAPLSHGTVHGLADPENIDFRSKIGFRPPEPNSLVFN